MKKHLFSELILNAVAVQQTVDDLCGKEEEEEDGT